MNLNHHQRTGAVLSVHIIILICVATALPCFGADELCGGKVSLTSPERIVLTEGEKKLVCGDEETEAWSLIPPRQAAYFLKVFLSERGYHKPNLTIQGEKLAVDSGPLILARATVLELAETSDAEARVAVETIDLARYWQILGAPITRKALDGLEKWVKSQLGERGMPCAGVTLKADPEDGVITVLVNHARILQVPRIKSDPIPGINGEVQRRFYAFDEGDTYNALEFDLSARRIVESDVVLSSSFSTQCTQDGYIESITQRQIPGEPRLVSFGIGFDTEEFGIIDASWKHSRIGYMASNASAGLRASFRKQTAKLGFDWYYTPIIAQHFLRSLGTFERTNERREDTRLLEARTGPVWQKDFDQHGAELFIGAALRHTETIRGVGPTTSDSVIALVNASATTHDFEYYRQTPRSGHDISFQYNRARKGMASDISFSRYQVRATALSTLFSLDPPVWIFGLRASVSATSLDSDTTLDKVPLTLRNFLGGSQDLRGFGRKSLPASDEGSLTTAYFGGEIRVREVLPYELQPFIFADSGRLGGDGLTLERDTYWSPGIGLQWQSPIGTFRSTLAHGFIEGPSKESMQHLERWQFYFSFGEQF